jgi:hypothetical protein
VWKDEECEKGGQEKEKRMRNYKSSERGRGAARLSVQGRKREDEIL